MAELEKVINELNNLPTTVYAGFYQLRITHDLRDNVVKLLKEQQKRIETLEKIDGIKLDPKWPYIFNTYRRVVLCKDCKDRRVCIIAKKHDGFSDNKFDPDWFCASGELDR